MNYITQDMVIQLFSNFSRWGREMDRDPFWGVHNIYRLSDEVRREAYICLEQVKQWCFEVNTGKSQMADSGVEWLIRIHLENAERVVRVVHHIYFGDRPSSPYGYWITVRDASLSVIMEELHSYRTGWIPPSAYYPHKYHTTFPRISFGEWYTNSPAHKDSSLDDFRNKQLGDPYPLESDFCPKPIRSFQDTILPVKCSDCHTYPSVNVGIGGDWYRLYCERCKCGTRRFSNQKCATEAWNRMH